MKRVIQLLAERLLRFATPALHTRVGVLEWRVDSLQRGLDFALEDEWSRWLYLNRAERMDATVEFFDTGRREFHLNRYRFAAEHVAGRSVADIASGTGYGTELLRRRGNADSVVGIDIDASAVEYARHRHLCDRIRFERAAADATGLDDASIEVLVSFETIEHVHDDHLLIDEFARILAPGGTLICSVPNRWPVDVAEHHVREYDERSFTDLLEPVFDIKAMYNQNSGMPKAPFNRGQPAGIVPTTRNNASNAECFIAISARRQPPEIELGVQEEPT